MEPKGGLDLLERTTRLVRERQRGRKRHVAALLLFEVIYQTTTELDSAGAGRAANLLHANYVSPTCVKPGYSGA